MHLRSCHFPAQNTLLLISFCINSKSFLGHTRSSSNSSLPISLLLFPTTFASALDPSVDIRLPVGGTSGPHLPSAGPSCCGILLPSICAAGNTQVLAPVLPPKRLPRPPEGKPRTPSPSIHARELLQSTVTSSVHLFYSFTCLLLSLEHKLHEDRDIVFFLLEPLHLEECLAHSSSTDNF